MAGDVLNDPLGQGRPPTKKHRPWLALAAVVVLAAAVAAVTLYRPLRAPPPDQATAVVALPAPPAKASPPDEPATPPRAAPVTQTAEDTERESGVKIVRPAGSPSAGATIIQVPQAVPIALPPAPDPRLVERGPYGPLPRRGPGDARPASVYARPSDPAAATTPRVAIVVGGMGLNSQSTATASTQLPPEVTLGFAPYGDHLGQQVARAREAGHEVLLQLPMESLDASSDDGLSHVLLTGQPAKDTLDRLHWLMSRFVGYAGVANFLGAKFTADADAFDPVLRDLAARGLFYLDDGSSPRSLASTLSPQFGLPAARADVVLDGTPDETRKSLQKLEALARAHGTALGFASGLPATTELIRAYLRGLGDRGLTLVPVSALAGSPARNAGGPPP